MTPSLSVRDGRYVDPLGRRVLIAVLTCDQYEERVGGQRETWLTQLPATYQVVYVRGVPGSPPTLVGDGLTVDCEEAYEQLPHKVSALLAWAAESAQFDYLFKTDDDTFLDLERFITLDLQGADYVGQFRELTGPVPERAKTYHYGKCTDPAYEVPYERPFVCPWATGGGYFLSRRAVEAAARRTAETWQEHLFEDVMVGEAVHDHAELTTLTVSFAQMGVVNPLLPKDMRYLQEVLAERHDLVRQLQSLQAEVEHERGAPPRVSVVMPVHNAPAVLERAVRCVLDQTLSSLELICVDDASSDDSLGRVRALAATDPRIRVVALTANRGEGGARNAGIEAMRGDYLFCMDPDDEVPPRALEHLLATAEQTRCDLVMAKYDWLRTPDAPRTATPATAPPATVTRIEDSEWLQGVPGGHWCNLYSRALVRGRGLRYVEELAIGCDQIFQADAMLRAGDVALLDEVVYVYHHYNPDSLTKRTLSLAFYLSDIEYTRRICRSFDQRGLGHAAVRRLQDWAWSIREYWVRIPECLDRAQAHQLFSSVRDLLAEFGVTEPWVAYNREEYRNLMRLIQAGQDELAIDYIERERERML